MCGIVAFLLHPKVRSAEEWQAIRNIFTWNLIFNEERGRDASGLALIRADGSTEILKLPLPASEFVNTQEYQVLLNSIDQDTVQVLGHTRLPTKGTPARSGNNHPLKVGPVIGVHNGLIENDDALFARLGYSRQAEVDSEIIFHMLTPHVPAALDGHYLEAIRPCLQLLQGQFTFLACHLSDPGKLLVLKHRNPLCAHYHDGWSALIFSSRYLFLRKAFGGAVLTETLPPNILLHFDAYRLPQLGFKPAATLPLFAHPPQEFE